MKVADVSASYCHLQHSETTKTVIVKVADVSASYCHLGYNILKLQRQL